MSNRARTKNATPSSSNQDPPPPPRIPKKSVPPHLANDRNFMNNVLSTPNARNLYRNVFSKKGIRNGRNVDISLLENPQLNFRFLPHLREWGLMNFLQIPCIFYPNMVRAFFASCERDDVDSPNGNTILRVKFNLNGRDYYLTQNILAQHLGLHRSGVFDEKLPSNFHAIGTSINSLDIHERLLHLLISHIFRPSLAHSQMRDLDRWWLHHFQDNNRIDLASIIFSEIIHVHSSPSGGKDQLPYGWVISFVLQKMGIQFIDESPICNPSLINLKSLKLAKLVRTRSDGTLVFFFRTRSDGTLVFFRNEAIPQEVGEEENEEMQEEEADEDFGDEEGESEYTNENLWVKMHGLEIKLNKIDQWQIDFMTQYKSDMDFLKSKFGGSSSQGPHNG